MLSERLSPEPCGINGVAPTVAVGLVIGLVDVAVLFGDFRSLEPQHMLLFGRPFDAQEIVRKIEAVDAAAVIRAARRIGAGPLTLTALGPIDRLEDYRRVTSRLAA